MRKNISLADVIVMQESEELMEVKLVAFEAASELEGLAPSLDF